MQTNNLRAIRLGMTLLFGGTISMLGATTFHDFVTKPAIEPPYPDYYEIVSGLNEMERAKDSQNAPEMVLHPSGAFNPPEVVVEAAEDACLNKFYDTNIQLSVPQCARYGIATAWVESKFEGKAVGDGSRSRGGLQIQVKLHDVTVEQAEDWRYSFRFWATWMRDCTRPVTGNWAYCISSWNGAGPDADRYAEKVMALADEYEARGMFK